MGWKILPLYFTTATETIADLANSALKAGRMVQPHPLDERAARLEKIVESSKDSFATTPQIKPDPSIPLQEQ
jgi:hypothetical protein